MIRIYTWIPVLGLLMFAGCKEPLPINKASVKDLSPADIQYHVNYLASDALAGRLAGTPGSEAATKYIAAEMRRFGLSPLGDGASLLQKFDFIGDVELGAKNGLHFRFGNADTALTLTTDFMPAGFSASDSIEAQIAFAGYGIVAKEQGYDDYEGIEVEGRAVLALEGAPAAHDPHSGFSSFAPIRYKALQARQRGAGALLVVWNVGDRKDEALPKLRNDRASGDAGLPVIFVTRAAADWLLAKVNLSVDSLRAGIDAGKRPHSFAMPEARITVKSEINKIRREAANVIGILRGSDPQLRSEGVVIGAHYDHLGRSSEGALDPDSVDQIRNGADDNASGTAGVLELAQYFSALSPRPKRSLIFMAFGAEELGLLGSAHYVNQPTFPLEKTIAMINMDMIGRMKDSALVVQGIGTSPRWPEMIERLNAASNFKLSLKKDGLGPSDHSSFYQKNVPVLFFFTGLHDDYHRVSDDADKINAAQEAEILKLIAKVITEIANSDSVPLFTKVDEEPRREARGFRVSLGTVPDYAAEVEGVKLSGVRVGGPAERAGIRAGDIIVKLGIIEVKNIYDYTYALGEYAPGQEVEVVVMRAGERVATKVKFDPGRRM